MSQEDWWEKNGTAAVVGFFVFLFFANLPMSAKSALWDFLGGCLLVGFFLFFIYGLWEETKGSKPLQDDIRKENKGSDPEELKETQRKEKARQTPNTGIMSVNIEFYAPNGLHYLDKIIISHFASLGYRSKVQQPPVLEFTRGSQRSCFFRFDIRSYQTDVTVRIYNETEQGTRIRVDFEVVTGTAVTTKSDAAVLEAEGRGLESKIRSVNVSSGQSLDSDAMNADEAHTGLPEFAITVPQNNAILENSVTLTVDPSDANDIVSVHFFIRESDGEDGKRIGYENLAGTFNETTGQWEYPLDTAELPDGYYFILAKAVDGSNNEGWERVDVGKGGYASGVAYHKSGDYQEAIEAYGRGIDSKNHVDSYISLAYLYATCPKSKFRDGEKALELAKKACELTNFEDACCLSSLAAAFAECGDFQKAIEYQEKAVKLIREEGTREWESETIQEVAEEWEQRLEMYASGKPYRFYLHSPTQ